MKNLLFAAIIISLYSPVHASFLQKAWHPVGKNIIKTPRTFSPLRVPQPTTRVTTTSLRNLTTFNRSPVLSQNNVNPMLATSIGIRFYSTSSNQEDVVKKFTQDEENMEKFKKLVRESVREELNSFEELQQLRHPGNLEEAQSNIVKEIMMKEGLNEDEAKARFEAIDADTDGQRRLWNLPYVAGLGTLGAGIPFTWALVYNEKFYTAFIEMFPAFENTSWDWSEPLVQSLLTTQTAGALMMASLAALGYHPYMKYRNLQLAKRIAAKYNLDVNTVLKWLRFDR